MMCLPQVLKFIFIFIFSIGLVSAIAIDNPNLPLVRNPPTVVTFNNNTAFVNSSDIWITAEGNKDNVADILASEITDDGVWRTLLNGTFTFNISIDDNNISDLDTINFDDEHYIRKGGLYPFTDLTSDAFIFHHNEEHAVGSIAFAFTQMNRTMIASQIGRNNSAGILGNSWMVIPNNLSTNYSLYSDCLWAIDQRGLTPRIFCDTADTGSDLFVDDDIQLGGTIFAEEGIRAENFANFIMNGNDFSISNGSLLLQTPVNFTTGFEAGETVVLLNEPFAVGIGQFVNLQSDAGNWVQTTSGNCESGQCALGTSAGGGTVSMQTNVSTLGFEDCNVTFGYSILKDSGPTLSLEEDNNEGTSNTIFSESPGNDVTLQSAAEDLSAAMDNRSVVSLTFTHSADEDKPEDQSYVDNFIVTCVASENTTANINSFDGEICYRDGSRDSEGDCNTAWFYDAETNQMLLRGATLNASGTIIGGISGSGTTNNVAKFTSSTSIGNSQISDNGSLITLSLPTEINNDTTISANLLVEENLTAGDTGADHRFYTANRGAAGEGYIGITNFPWLGVLNFPEIYGVAHGGTSNAITMRDLIWLRGANQNPQISFFDAAASGSVSIIYDRTLDKLIFQTASGGYSFDDDLTVDGGSVIIDSDVFGFILGEDGDYTVRSTSNNAVFNLDRNDVNTQFFASGSGVILAMDAGSKRVGFATDSPQSTLHVVGTSRLGGQTTHYTRVSPDGNITQFGTAIANLQSLNVTSGNAWVNDGSFTVRDGNIRLADGNLRVDEDGRKAEFGESQDSSIYYDGTDMYINPKEVGSGGLKVLGNLTLNTNSVLNMTMNDTTLLCTSTINNGSIMYDGVRHLGCNGTTWNLMY